MTGSQTAAVAFGGNNPSPTASRTDTENYNGTSWTEANNMNTARDENSLSGRGAPYTSVISVFGSSTEVWDGTNWAESTEVNTPRKAGAGAGASSTSAIIYGGSPHPVALTESWDGTSWTEVADLGTGRLDGGTTGGSASNALYAGGNPPYTGATEEWSFPPPTSAALNEGDVFLSGGATLKGFGKNAGLPSATWASGATYPTSIYAAAGFGTQDSAVVGSYAPGGGTEAASYNGTSWTVITDVSTDSTEKTGFGESNSSGYLVKGNTENWNGSSWTEVNDATNSFSLRTGFGSPSSAIVAAGESPPSGSNLVESWDGTSWTEVSELNTARYAAGGGGSGNTSGIIAGGTTGSNTANSETWDGSSWSEGNNLNTARHRVGSAGKSVSSSLIFGGESITGKTESYNGSSWTELADMATARIDPAFGSTGTNVAALAVGGREPSASNKTEEFTADNTLSTVTVS